MDSMLESFQRMVSGVMGVYAGTATDEIYVSHSDLLEVCRNVGAFNWKIADAEPEGPSANKERRAEAGALGRYCMIYAGRTFTVRVGDTDERVTFESIGQGHQRKYKFTGATRI